MWGVEGKIERPHREGVVTPLGSPCRAESCMRWIVGEAVRKHKLISRGQPARVRREPGIAPALLAHSDDLIRKSGRGRYEWRGWEGYPEDGWEG